MKASRIRASSETPVSCETAGNKDGQRARLLKTPPPPFAIVSCCPCLRGVALVYLRLKYWVQSEEEGTTSALLVCEAKQTT